MPPNTEHITQAEREAATVTQDDKLRPRNPHPNTLIRVGLPSEDEAIENAVLRERGERDSDHE